MPNTSIFSGLCAFPPTPMDVDGVVDVDKLSILVDRLACARVDSIGLLGSTGNYAYLDSSQRDRAVAAAVEAAAGRTPVVVGIGSLRTSSSMELARAAERRGANGLLLAPMSYTPLTSKEVATLLRTAAEATELPLCIYNNPDTTRFTFEAELIGDLSSVANIAAVKMPPSAHGATELARLRERVPPSFKIGYSGDWVAASALLAGADAWFSVIAGLLPGPALQLTRAALSGRREETKALNRRFEGLWALFREHGSLRLMYDIADRLGLGLGEPPSPLQRVGSAAAAKRLDLALASIQ